jgi:uncharacterized protein
MEKFHKTIATQLAIRVEQVAATAGLLAAGATVPFIARYRKEATSLLDDVQITEIRDQLEKLAELDKRRQAITASLTELDLLTDALRGAILAAPDLTTLEDLYRPHRPKRKTRGSVAREKGLGPLAGILFAQDGRALHPEDFINPEEGIHTVDDAFAGARDIIAELINEDAGIRTRLRKIFAAKSMIVSSVVKKNEKKGAKFRDYFDWQEPAARVPSHRLLAMFRGENEKILRVSVRPPEDEPRQLLHRNYVKADRTSSSHVAEAVDDAYKRLLLPSLENELRNGLKEKADKEAIQVFTDNLKELLLAPPLGRKKVMALDPGFRTGAKLAVLDEQGQFLYFTAIYPTHAAKQGEAAGRTVKDLCRKYSIQAIGIGNGTASRETEAFVQSLDLGAGMVVTMVDESGASIYSASETARREFPDLDVTVRGAVSIGRRLQDPLAELVKIDPKSIGVGQYQHDVNQAELKKSLEDMVRQCVNSVGVEVNTASRELLSFVSGLGPLLAENIISYRNEHGPFPGRKELLKVPRLGAKAFEQCAGFLRIHGAQNPLDASGVHPERYGTVKQMADDAGVSVSDLMSKESAREQIDISRYVMAVIGLPTLTDIMTELARPGRDPRADFSVFSFAEGINSIKDVLPGMKVPGIVTNVTKFGAFVDIGVHQDGLIHISQLADRFVKDTAEIVRVRQRVVVRVLEVDQERQRIALSLKN